MRYSDESNFNAAEEIMAKGDPITYIVNTNPTKKMVNSHYHTYYEFTFMLSGEQHMIIGNDTYAAYSGQFVIFAPYIMHNRFASKAAAGERFVMYFTGELLDEELEERIKHASGCYAPGKGDSDLIRDKIKLLAKEIDKPSANHRLYLKYALGDLLLFILKSSKRMQEPESRQTINDVIAYINHYYYEDISTSSIAEHFFLSSEHLCRQFKKNTGRTITRYINMIRILNAKKALEETDQSITDISTSCGFTNLTHFYRVFKEQVGVPPSHYRQQALARPSEQWS